MSSICWHRYDTRAVLGFVIACGFVDFFVLFLYMSSIWIYVISRARVCVLFLSFQREREREREREIIYIYIIFFLMRPQEGRPRRLLFGDEGQPEGQVPGWVNVWTFYCGDSTRADSTASCRSPVIFEAVQGCTPQVLLGCAPQLLYSSRLNSHAS